MRIEDYQIGPLRWHIEVWPIDRDEQITFKSWMNENFPDVMCTRRYDARHYFEIRGTDIIALTTIKLTWG
jgi:hypothetical protein